MLKLKKLVACAVLLALCISPSAVLAETVATTPGTTSASAVLTTEPTVMSVTVPTSVLIYVDQQGDVTTPTDMAITNNSAAPISVTSLAVTTGDGWTLDPYSTDYSKTKVGHKNFSLNINGQDPSASALAFTDPINGGESLHLALSAKVSPQKTAINASQIGNIVVTVDWCGATPANNYVTATDADFSGTTDGSFLYIGTSPYVIVPNVIKGVPVTSYKHMFNGTAVQGVKSTNPNITNMDYMFANTTSTVLEFDLNTTKVTSMWSMFYRAKATTLDLSHLDTSSVTSMANMFGSTAATTLNLSNLNTSNVTDMSSMLSGTQTTTLDLHSFNTSKVTNMANMFNGSVATTLELNYLNTANVTNMTQMFYGSKATVLDMSSWDTSKLAGIGMVGMFQNSAATTINLSSFNTANVTSINNLFRGTQVTTLDLSTFDLSKVSSSLYTFKDALTTTVYARTQADADKLNASSYKPTGLTITVK